MEQKKEEESEEGREGSRDRRAGTYVGEALAAVKAQGLEAAVAEHLDDLGVLLAVLLEGQLSALVVILLCSSSAVLAALCINSSISSATSTVAGAGHCGLERRGGGGFLRTFPLFLGILLACNLGALGLRFRERGAQTRRVNAVNRYRRGMQGGGEVIGRGFGSAVLLCGDACAGRWGWWGLGLDLAA